MIMLVRVTSRELRKRQTERAAQLYFVSRNHIETTRQGYKQTSVHGINKAHHLLARLYES